MNKIEIKNEYLPKDTKDIINIMPNQISKNDFKDYNFAIIYNLPSIIEKNGELTIRLTERVDSFKWDQNWVHNINKRHSNAIVNLGTSGFHVKNFSSILSFRMVIGLGASHPQETSMTLHHIYGIPYIPGSAVKGVTRHWFILKKFEVLELPIEQINCFEKILETADLSNKNENKRDDKLSREEFEKKFKVKGIKPDEKLYKFLKDQQILINLFQHTFGTQNNIGKVIFFDAYPVNEIKLKIDVMTPHYPKYYSGSEPPADWQSPIPIKFLTVEKTKFSFHLASREEKLIEKAIKWLSEALKNYGIGAKTSLGYGVFENDK